MRLKVEKKVGQDGAMLLLLDGENFLGAETWTVLTFGSSSSRMCSKNRNFYSNTIHSFISNLPSVIVMDNLWGGMAKQ